MSRCYSITVQKRQPQYIGVTVCDEWHNFQNFAGWYYRRLMSIQHVAALDKDILSGDVKVYSPETCKLVTHRDNQEKAKAKYWMFKGPDGDDIEIYNLSKFCEENNLNSANMSKVHSMDRMSHKGWRKA